jgi:FG-GAP-like repeat
MTWGRALWLGMFGVLTLLTASSSARSLTAGPVFGSPKAVVPFTADEVGAATEMESGDLNGDGLPDVVVTRITYPPAHITHPIGIFLADGHGGFTDGSSMWDGSPTRTEWGRQIIIADFNGDHRNDIFVADHGYDAPPYPGHPNELALSTPQGKLVDASANLPPESGFSHSATAADVNRDGGVDIFVGNLCTACAPDAQPEILLNDGGGHFSRRTDLLPADLQDPDGVHRYTRSLFADVKGDDAPDLVLGADNNTANSRVLLNDGSGHFHDAPPLPPKPLGPTSILISLATLDINRDGRPDLLAGFTPGDPFYVGRRIQVLINNGDGTFRDETAQRLPKQDSGQGWPYAIRVADFNGDGHLDFTVDVNHYPVENAPIYLDGGKGIYHEVPFSAAAQLFAIVDANGDRRPDIFSTVAGGGGGLEQHFVQLEIVTPAAPRGLRALGRQNGIHLIWRRVPGATSYRVWRAAPSQKRRLIGTSIRPRYNDLHARRHITYTYRLQARNRAGTSPPSSAVRAKRP